jgi:hypothetical protein
MFLLQEVPEATRLSVPLVEGLRMEVHALSNQGWRGPREGRTHKEPGCCRLGTGNLPDVLMIGGIRRHELNLKITSYNTF